MEGWTRQFTGKWIVLLGPAPSVDPHGRLALFGVTTAEVVKVAVRYADGSDSVADALTGGFVALLDADREPVSLIATGADGQELQELDLPPYQSILGGAPDR